MSEAAIQLGLQTALRAMTEFDDADVVINDFSVFDGSTLAAPWIIIGNADEFESRQDAKTPNNRWTEIVTLVERYTNWKETLDNLRTRRQAIVDKINSADIRSAGGLAAVTIDVVRSDGPITPRYDPYLHDEREALPIFLFQDIALECEEF